MFPGRNKHFRRRQGAALNPKKQAGTGMGRFPGDLEVPANKTVWSAGGDSFFGVPGIAVHLRSMMVSGF